MINRYNNLKKDYFLSRSLKNFRMDRKDSSAFSLFSYRSGNIIISGGTPNPLEINIQVCFVRSFHRQIFRTPLADSPVALAIRNDDLLYFSIHRLNGVTRLRRNTCRAISETRSFFFFFMIIL